MNSFLQILFIIGILNWPVKIELDWNSSEPYVREYCFEARLASYYKSLAWSCPVESMWSIRWWVWIYLAPKEKDISDPIYWSTYGYGQKTTRSTVHACNIYAMHFWIDHLQKPYQWSCFTFNQWRSQPMARLGLSPCKIIRNTIYACCTLCKVGSVGYAFT